MTQTYTNLPRVLSAKQTQT